MIGETVTLVGAEDVRAAGNAMTSAAESIRQSVGHLSEELALLCLRLEAAVDRLEKFQRRSEVQP